MYIFITDLKFYYLYTQISIYISISLYRLERVHDTKYGKTYPAFKLISSADFLKEEKKSSTAKVLKKLPLNSRISDNDLSVKMQVIKRWLDKNCEVHVAVMRNNQSQAAMVIIKLILCYSVM